MYHYNFFYPFYIKKKKKKIVAIFNFSLFYVYCPYFFFFLQSSQFCYFLLIWKIIRKNRGGKCLINVTFPALREF